MATRSGAFALWLPPSRSAPARVAGYLDTWRQEAGVSQCFGVQGGSWTRENWGSPVYAGGMSRVPDDVADLRPGMLSDQKLGWLEPEHAAVSLRVPLPVKRSRTRLFAVRVSDGSASMVKVWEAAGWSPGDGVVARIVVHGGVVLEAHALGGLRMDGKQRVRFDRGLRAALGLGASGDVVALVKPGRVLLLPVSGVEPSGWGKW